MTKELMTWREASKRWVKKVEGVQHVVSCRQLGTEKTRSASRDAANKWWIERQKLIEQTNKTPLTILAHTNTKANLYEDLSREELIERLQHHNARVGKMLHDQVGRLVGKKARSIKAQIEALLAHKQAQAEAEILSVGRWAASKTHLEIFQTWIGALTLIDEITPAKLREYYQFLLAKEEWSRAYKATLFTSAKTFIRFLGEQELISLPGNLNSKNFSFGNTTKKIKYFTVPELKALLENATEHTKLYLLLMLNAGMYQSDISDLRHDEVNWKQAQSPASEANPRTTKAHQKLPTNSGQLRFLC